ncbi:MAG TPA: hypothetical protein EYP28_00015 [Methanophagales archaeon]|nr:hypothetical protein [Methanophagales archaeon]
MTDNIPVWIYDDIQIDGRDGVKMVCILESPLPDDLKNTIDFLIETGLSEAEKMRDVLQIMGDILRANERFRDIVAEMKSYRETIFSRSVPFNMIEARAILSKLRKWQNAIGRRLEL